MQEIEHLLNRIGFGPRPGDLERVRKLGIEKYIDQQLHPDRIDDSATDARLSSIPSIRMSTPEILQKYPRPQRLARELGDRRRVLMHYEERGLKLPQQLLQELIDQKVVRAVHSERQLQEVMADFWFNHFNVFWGKNANRWLTTAFDV
jgi:hypothetical protein